MQKEIRKVRFPFHISTLVLDGAYHGLQSGHKSLNQPHALMMFGGGSVEVDAPQRVKLSTRSGYDVGATIALQLLHASMAADDLRHENVHKLLRCR